MVQWKMEGCMLEYKLVTVMTTAQAPPSHCFSNPALVTCPGLGREIASFWNNKRSCWRWNSVWCSGKWKDACLYTTRGRSQKVVFRSACHFDFGPFHVVQIIFQTKYSIAIHNDLSKLDCNIVFQIVCQTANTISRGHCDYECKVNGDSRMMFVFDMQDEA